MTIFKYCSAFGLDILSQRRIKLSRAHLLNDPFELSPSINPASFTIATAMKFLRQPHEIDEWYRREGRVRGFTNKKRYRDWYLENLRSRAESLMPRVSKNVEDARARFAQTFSEHWRLFCTSKRHDSILMWSHYAKDHTGLVIEFDFTSEPFRSLGSTWVLPVQYSASKAGFDYQPGRTGRFIKSLLSVVATKSEDLSYEHEVRAVFPATACNKEDFLPVYPQSIRRVIFGCRASVELESAVKSALCSDDFSHVELQRASQSRDRFSLEFNALA